MNVLKTNSKRFAFILIVLYSIIASGSALPDKDLKNIREGFELRRQQAFEALRERPLVVASIQAPLEPGRALFSRMFSYSLVDYAFKSLWLNIDIDKANEALQQNADYYIDNLPAMGDRDSFYWASDEWLRLLEFYGTNGSLNPGLISKETEEKLFEMMWQYNKVFSVIEKAEFKESKTWHVDESENHHIQRFSTYWHFAKYLKDLEQYKELKYDDGYNSQQHFDAWNLYAKHWIVERAKKGLFVEMANEVYALETLKGVYNFYDFGDKSISKLSENLLNLYWASWAEEQLHGVRGGSKNRVYPGRESKSGRRQFWQLAWYYLGIGEPTHLQRNLFTLVSSKYRLPLVVMDIALDNEGRGEYQIVQRRMGLAKEGFHMNPDYRLRTDSGGIVRYSYCTPDFILGAAHFKARKWQDWTLISSQNRWHGVIFSDSPDARIFPQASLNDTYRAYNQHWSVQEKGCMITQKLPEGYAWDGHPMRVFFSTAGINSTFEKEGWVFVATANAFAAVKAVDGGYFWENDVDGRWLMCNNELSPIIIEVVRASNYDDFQHFQQTILANKLSFDGRKLNYQSSYGDRFEFFADYTQLANVNGKQINLQPKLVFDSPFVSSTWDSGTIMIKKDKRKLRLKFKI
jgi:hypothetical protein